MTEDKPFVTGLTTDEALANAETIESVTTAIRSDIDEKTKDIAPPMNRAQRRALMKKQGKKGRQHLNLISDTAKKLDYIELIQKLRELNAKKEKEENEGIN